MGRPVTVAVIGVLVIAALSFGITRWQISMAEADGKAKADSAAKANAPIMAEQARRDTLTRLLDTLVVRAEQLPNDSMLVVSAANIAYNLERFDIAERFYRRFLDSIDPKNVDVTIDYAYSVFMNGRTTEAIKILEDVIERRPKHQAALYNLGILHLRSNATDKGLEWIRRCRDADPTSDIGRRAANLATTLERTS
jgi:tetratricopeptide (TPR) repeat protein